MDFVDPVINLENLPKTLFSLRMCAALLISLGYWLEHEKREDLKIKDDGTHYTDAEIQASLAFEDQMRIAFPTVATVTEDGVDDGKRYDSIGCFWGDLVDSSFRYWERKPLWSVSLGYTFNGEAKLGMVFRPYLEQLVWGGDRLGVHVLSTKTREHRLIQHQRNLTPRLLRSDTRKDDLVESYARTLPPNDVDSSSGMVKILHLLLNDWTLCLWGKTNPVKKTDICPYDALLRGRNGMITTFDRKYINYLGGDDLLNEGIIAASNGMVYESAMRDLERLALPSMKPTAERHI